MRAISVFNYILSIIVFWDGQVEGRICKWKLLSDDRIFVAAFAQFTSFRRWGLVFHIVLKQTECKLSFDSLIKAHGQDLSALEISVHLVSCV